MHAPERTTVECAIWPLTNWRLDKKPSQQWEFNQHPHQVKVGEAKLNSAHKVVFSNDLSHTLTSFSFPLSTVHPGLRDVHNYRNLPQFSGVNLPIKQVPVGELALPAPHVPHWDYHNNCRYWETLSTPVHADSDQRYLPTWAKFHKAVKQKILLDKFLCWAKF